MSRTFTNLLIHLIFSTKHREPMIVPEIESELHRYLGGLTRDLKGKAYEINGTLDHVHMLVSLPPVVSISDALRYMKANSSGWVHDKWPSKPFAWQLGYGAFSVSKSNVLIAGLDPTGNGGVVAGFGDQRQVELLVEAGFTPVEAIKIASFIGAKFLGEDARIGSITAGKQADLMVVKGNPAANINDIEKVEIAFKDSVGYDSEKLIQSVQGLVGHSLSRYYLVGKPGLSITRLAWAICRRSCTTTIL